MHSVHDTASAHETGYIGAQGLACVCPRCGYTHQVTVISVQLGSSELGPVNWGQCNLLSLHGRTLSFPTPNRLIPVLSPCPCLCLEDGARTGEWGGKEHVDLLRVPAPWRLCVHFLGGPRAWVNRLVSRLSPIVPAECDSTQAGDGQGVDLEARLLDATRFSLRADRALQEIEGPEY